MFKSLTSFIFGANTSVNVNQDQLKQEEEEEKQQRQLQQPEQKQQEDQQKQSHPVNVENTIEVDSCTNSITAGPSSVNKKNNRTKGRGKNRRNNNNNKRKEVQESLKQVPLPEQEREKEKRERKQTKSLPSITKLLTPNNEFKEDLDEENDDDDWIILEKEDEADSLPRSDSEEKVSVVEVKELVEPPVADSFTVISVTDSSSDTPTNPGAAAAPIAAVAPALRRRQNIGSHSLYSGPRPQQQRNYLQRSRSGRLHSLSTSSPSRSVASILDDGNKSPEVAAASASAPSSDGLGWGGMTQSLYVASPIAPESGFPISMEESWFVTPPPCFTSIGPINMETSPYENLLIEHPSMSVYYSIRSAQEATQRFVNLDLGMKEAQQQQHGQQQEEKRQNDEQMKKLKLKPKPNSQKEIKTHKTQQQQQQLKQTEDAPEAKSAVVPRRPSAARIDRFTAAQLKQELLARSNQKSHIIQERRQAGCRGAILRANRVREYQSKGKPQRRADMQHFRLVSGANNNRKCCC